MKAHATQFVAVAEPLTEPNAAPPQVLVRMHRGRTLNSLTGGPEMANGTAAGNIIPNLGILRR